MPLLYLFILFIFSPITSFADVISRGKNCSCGFIDPQSEQFYTDSIIIYFNETNALSTDFVVEDFTHVYEKDWNAVYREAADPANVKVNDSDYLDLVVTPPDEHRIVKGGGIRTLRRDIQYGSFRTLIRSPRKSFRGSAMSMTLRYNESEITELSILNQNKASDAWVGTFINNEFTARDLGVNFTQLLEQPNISRDYTPLAGGFPNATTNAWDFTEYRIDWTTEKIDFYVGGNLTRRVLRENDNGIASVPAPLYLKHWSTGNRYSMQGPPQDASTASVGWLRMFFNSSTAKTETPQDFAIRCSTNEVCLLNDPDLRGSTSYSEEETREWKQITKEDVHRLPALWISVGCLALSTLLVAHTLIRRLTKAQVKGPRHTINSPLATTSGVATRANSHVEESAAPSLNYGTYEPSRVFTSSHLDTNPPISRRNSEVIIIETMQPLHGFSEQGTPTPSGTSRASSFRFDSLATTPSSHSLFSGPTANNTREQLYYPSPSITELPPVPNHASDLTLTSEQGGFSANNKVQMETVTESALPAPRMKPQLKLQKQRVDHLAGLTALCAIFVTVMHFGLTFVPAMVIPGSPQHTRAEYWVQKIAAPLILNQMWLGVFFTTSVRFLTAAYFRSGDVEQIAKAAVRRTPRLIAPVAAVAMLEYFLIDIGATSYLRYIPSLTWSTWPYVTRFENFGQFVSEILELVYLVPNAIPKITLHYCTGVLWTIAVQLQGSWLVLVGAVVVYEMKTMWKRIIFYSFCITNHWYANSWGAYFWLGLLLTDLDITYKWKKFLAHRPLAYYPLIGLCWLCVIAGFGVNIIPNWVDFNFATMERNIHPDIATGEPVMNTANAGYPEYYTPRLNGLLFAGGMQAIVELSSVVQWILSSPPLLILFPHIFTIYLLHGLVFWTWGSWLLIFQADRGIHYSISVTVVGVTSYALLFLSLPIVTPILEALGKDLTALIWMTAQEKSPPRRPTLFPFPDDLLTGRAINKPNTQNADVETGVQVRRSLSTVKSGDYIQEKPIMKGESCKSSEGCHSRAYKGPSSADEMLPRLSNVYRM